MGNRRGLLRRGPTSPESGRGGCTEARGQRVSSWTSASGEILTLAFFVFAPGGAITFALGLRGLRAVLVAPGVSVGLLAGGAVLFGAVGVPWNPWTVVGLAVCAPLIVMGARTVVHARGRSGRGAHSDETRRTDRVGADRGLATTLTVVGILIGAAAAAVPLARGMGGPNLFPQDWDIMFHLSATRYVIDSGNASSLHLSHMTDPTGTGGFYPAAWHGLAALGGQNVPTSTNALLLVLAAFVLPMGLAGLAREILPGNPFAGFFAPIFASGFVSFPTVSIVRASLPNVLSYMLVPAALAVTVALVRRAGGRRAPTEPPVPALALVLALSGVGIALAHPNGVLVYGVAATPLLVHAAVQFARNSWASSPAHVRVLMVGAEAGLAAVWVFVWWRIWVLFSNLHETGQRGDSGMLEGLRLALTDAGSARAGILLAVAALVVLLRADSRWLLGAAGALAVLAGFAESSGSWSELTRAWFMDPNRLRAATSILAMAVLGVGAAIAVAVAVARLGTTFAASALRAGIAVAVAAACVVATGTLRAGARESLLNGVYVAVTGESVPANMASLDEIAMLERIRHEVEPGKSVIGNPFSGTTFVYGIGGVPVVYTNLGTNRNPDTVFLGLHFDEIDTNPAVCAAVRRQGIGYFYFDPDTWFPGHPGMQQYSGLLKPPPPGSGFERVDSGGTATLYRITTCG